MNELPISEDGFCVCNAKLVFQDNGSRAEYQCHSCLAKYQVVGTGTKLYEISTGQAGNIFDSLLRGSAHDPCNLKVDIECPKCARAITTFLMLGREEKPFVTCKCGYKMAVSGR